MTTDTWSWLDGEMSFIPTNERVFVPCTCCGKSMVKDMHCIPCTATKERTLKGYITMFCVSMVLASTITMVVL